MRPLLAIALLVALPACVRVPKMVAGERPGDVYLLTQSTLAGLPIRTFLVKCAEADAPAGRSVVCQRVLEGKELRQLRRGGLHQHLLLRPGDVAEPPPDPPSRKDKRAAAAEAPAKPEPPPEPPPEPESDDRSLQPDMPESQLSYLLRRLYRALGVAVPSESTLQRDRPAVRRFLAGQKWTMGALEAWVAEQQAKGAAATSVHMLLEAQP